MKCQLTFYLKIGFVCNFLKRRELEKNKHLKRVLSFCDLPSKVLGLESWKVFLGYCIPD